MALLITAVNASSETQSSSPTFTRNFHKTASHLAPNQFPWHVFIPSVKCSGVFIHERWVMTSASCVSRWKAKPKVDGWFPFGYTFAGNRATLFIRVGNHHVDFKIPGEDTVPVLESLVYPDHNANSSQGDIGLLYLARKVILPNGRHHPLVSLPDVESVKSLRLADYSAKVVGWGHESAGRDVPFRTLGQNDALLNSSSICLQRFKKDPDLSLSSDSWLCASAGNKGMCSIDQGSPVVIKQNNSWVVVGIYSRGEPCEVQQSTALFSRIDAKVLKWIRKLHKVKGES